MDLTTLKCELVRISILFSQRSLWGFDCDIEELERKINELFNKILLVENITTCSFPAKLYRDIEVDISRLAQTTLAGFCTSC